MASRRGGGGGAENMRAKVYIGNLPRDASEHEVDRAFRKFGPLRNVWVARRPPGFAFVEFEDERDAEDAVQSLDGANLCGNRVRVEFSNGYVRPKNSRDGFGGGRGRSPIRDRSRSRSRTPRRERDRERCVYCHSSDHSPRDCPDRIRRRSRSGDRRSRSRSPRAKRDRNGDDKPTRRKSRSPSEEREVRRRSSPKIDHKASSSKNFASKSKRDRDDLKLRDKSESKSRSASKSVEPESKSKQRDDDDEVSRSDPDERSPSKPKSDEEDDD